MIFWVEMQKARRRHDLLLCLLVPLTMILWVGGLAPSDPGELANGYSALFYSIPVIEAISGRPYGKCERCACGAE